MYVKKQKDSCTKNLIPSLSPRWILDRKFIMRIANVMLPYIDSIFFSSHRLSMEFFDIASGIGHAGNWLNYWQLRPAVYILMVAIVICRANVLIKYSREWMGSFTQVYIVSASFFFFLFSFYWSDCSFLVEEINRRPEKVLSFIDHVQYMQEKSWKYLNGKYRNAVDCIG